MGGGSATCVLSWAYRSDSYYGAIQPERWNDMGRQFFRRSHIRLLEDDAEHRVSSMILLIKFAAGFLPPQLPSLRERAVKAAT